MVSFKCTTSAQKMLAAIWKLKNVYTSTIENIRYYTNR